MFILPSRSTSSHGSIFNVAVAPYLQRHDFSRWFGQVFRDCPLATHVRTLESRLGLDRPRDLINDIAQAVRARYELTSSLPAGA